jgi:hypothetical protein
MLTSTQPQIMFHLTGYENRTSTEIASALQIAREDCRVTLNAVKQHDLLCCCVRLI